MVIKLTPEGVTVPIDPESVRVVGSVCRLWLVCFTHRFFPASSFGRRIFGSLPGRQSRLMGFLLEGVEQPAGDWSAPAPPSVTGVAPPFPQPVSATAAAASPAITRKRRRLIG